MSFVFKSLATIEQCLSLIVHVAFIVHLSSAE